MATFKAEVQNRRADGTYNVRIRVTHHRTVRRIPTNIYVTDDDLGKGLRIRNQHILDLCEDLLRRCREACNDMGFGIEALTPDELVAKVRSHLAGGGRFRLDFIEYGRKFAETRSLSSRASYLTAINALRRYTGRDTLDISEVTPSMLHGFECFLLTEVDQRNPAKGRHKNGGGCVLCLQKLRAIYNAALLEFNDEERTRIKANPFKRYRMPPRPVPRRRGLPAEVIQRIISLPSEGNRRGSWDFAKDVFILSFALVGMNAADMYTAAAPRDGVITYHRRKTSGRRRDGAEMRLRLEPCIDALLEKYADPAGERLFCFYHRYNCVNHLTQYLNASLKRIGAAVGVEGLQFYAARHSWATIARSSAVNIDKYTVHEALNHAGGAMAITDIYIVRDWSTIWEANRRVLDLFDWSAVGYDLL